MLTTRTYLAVRDGSNLGSRALSFTANLDVADYDALQEIRRSGSVLGHGDITQIVIYKATGLNQAVPPACLIGGVDGLCNVYTASDFETPEISFASGTYPPAMHWPGSQRNASRITGSDYIGVYVSAKTGGAGFPFPETLTHSNVVQLQSTSL